jgi:uncharacterized membrane protein (DUF373 family)
VVFVKNLIVALIVLAAVSLAAGIISRLTMTPFMSLIASNFQEMANTLLLFAIALELLK